MENNQPNFLGEHGGFSGDTTATVDPATVDHIKRSKKLIFLQGNPSVMKAMEDLYHDPNLKLKVITQEYDPNLETEPQMRKFEDLTEFQKKRRVYNYYLRFITMEGIDIILISIPLSSMIKEVLLELADGEKMAVLEIDVATINPKEFLIQKKTIWKKIWGLFRKKK